MGTETVESTDLNEPIEVVTRFAKKNFFPLLFYWGERTYHVQKVEGRWERRKGSFRIYSFAITVESGNSYEIELDTQQMQWKIRKTWER